PARAVRIIDDGDVRAEDALAEFVLQEARAACDRGAVDGARQMTEQAAGDAGVIADRPPGGRRLAGVEPLHRPFAGALADGGGILEIAAVDGRRVVVVALHARALAGEHGGADAVM